MFTILLCIFIIFPVFSIPIILIYSLNNNKNHRKYILLLSLSIGIIAYNTSAYLNPHLDIYKHFQLMDLMRVKGIWIVENIYISQPIISILFYIISLTGNNKILLFLSGFISYYLGLSICYKSFEKIHIDYLGKIIIIFFFSCVMPWDQMFSGIRFIIAGMIFIYALYIDFIHKNKKIFPIFLYVIAIFIHTSLIIPIIIRIIIKYQNKYTYILLNIAILIWPTYIKLIDWILSFIDSIPVFNELRFRLNIYINTKNHSYNYNLINNLSYIIIALIIFSITVYIKKKHSMWYRYNEKYLEFINTFICFWLPALKFRAIGDRFANLTMIIIIPLIIKYINVSNKPKKILIYTLIVFFGLLFLWAQILYGKRWLTFESSLIKLIFYNLFFIL